MNDDRGVGAIVRLTQSWEDMARAVDAEVERARKKFPDTNNVTLAMVEEAGEAVRAALNHYHGDGELEPIYKELIQTMAMCVRIWKDGDKSIDLPGQRWPR